jgi:hypothetical protein
MAGVVGGFVQVRGVAGHNGLAGFLTEIDYVFCEY